MEATLPKSVQYLIISFENRREQGLDAYKNCALLVEQLNAIGWTCDYGLDGEPYDFKKL